MVTQLQDTLQGLCTGRGTGNASLESKLLQHLADMMEKIIYTILLDIHKAYDTLDCGFYLDILVAYGVGPESLCLLRRYWEHIYMVERSDRYFGASFKGQSGVTKVYPISPTTFNVVVYMVFLHWLSVVAEAEGGAGPKGFGRDIQRLGEYFYADDGLVTSTRLSIIQREFNVLVELFNQVGLFKN